MSHVRQQIREHLGVILADLLTPRMNVFASRIFPHDEDHLPSLSIYMLTDVAEEDYETLGDAQVRALAVRIEGRAKATQDLDNLLDDIEVDVMAAVYADRTLGGLVKDIAFRSTEITLSGAADKPVGLIALDFVALYRIDGTDPTVIIP